MKLHTPIRISVHPVVQWMLSFLAFDAAFWLYAGNYCSINVGSCKELMLFSLLFDAPVSFIFSWIRPFATVIAGQQYDNLVYFVMLPALGVAFHAIVGASIGWKRRQRPVSWRASLLGALITLLIVMIVSASLFLLMTIFEKPPKVESPRVPVLDASTEVTYEDDTDLLFTVAYPALYSRVEKSADGVTFRVADPNELGGFAVKVMPTNAMTTREWLQLQPSGDASHAGFQEVFWIDGPDGAEGARAIVAEYVILDYDGTTPIYGQVLREVAVHHGRLYSLVYKNQFPAGIAPQVPADMIAIMASLHFY